MSEPASAPRRRREPGFPVVGAGSSGAALAARLVERGHDVDLLDAGPDWRSEELPASLRLPSPDIFAWRLSPGSRRDAPEFAWEGLTARRFADSEPAPYVRGRGLGGTSTVNGLVAIRPPLEEFDEWAAAGCAGWSAADVLPRFARSEDDLDYGALPYHGRGGPVPIVRRLESDWGSTDQLLADGARAAGLPWSPDHNAPGAFGVSKTAINHRMSVRVTTNDGYLEGLRHDPRLRIVGGALVDRLIVEGGRVEGVVAVTADGVEEFRAAHVVLCAGAMATPAILQRSGIGPAPLLRGLGIDVVADLPVGEGVQDHFGLWFGVVTPEGRRATTGARGNVTVRYSSGLPGSASGDILMVSANPLRERPDLGLLGVKIGYVHARGGLRITGKDPGAVPDVEFGLLSDERDRALARRAFRDAAGFVLQEAVAGRVTALVDRDGEPVDPDWDDSSVDSFLRRTGADTSHASSGVRMGDPDAVTTVVGPDCGVLGVPGVSVADLSICPWAPRANTHLTAVMIGERAADVLAAR